MTLPNIWFEVEEKDQKNYENNYSNNKEIFKDIVNNLVTLKVGNNLKIKEIFRKF